MRRSNPPASAALLLVASLLPASATGAGLSAGQRAEAIQLERDVCASLCMRRLRACPQGATEPDCNAGYIGCVVTSCQVCMPAFQTCLQATDATAKACQSPFVACLKPSLAALRTKPGISFSGGNGATQAQAVVIDGARTEPEGIVSEDLWVLKTHPSWQKQDQALLNNAGKVYDRIGYEAPDGHHETWFDITGFFGKM